MKGRSMARSFVEYAGDGSTTQFDLTFDYISRDDVSVLVDGVSVPFTFVTDSRVQANSAPAGGTTVKVSRTTSRDALEVTFTDGTTFLAEDLNTGLTQMFYLSQEALDGELSITSNIEVDWSNVQNIPSDVVNITTLLADKADASALSSYATVASLSGYAPLSSPALTGTPTAPTVASNDNSTSIATTAWVRAQGYSAGGGGSTTIAGLTDVSVTAPVNGDYLVYNSGSGEWVNTTIAAEVSLLNDLTDVSLTTPAEANLLAYTSGSWSEYTLVETDIPALSISKTTGLQAALDGKAASSHTHAAADITSGTLADARVAASNVTQHEGALTLAVSQVTNLQTSLDAKAPTANPTFTGAANFATIVASGEITAYSDRRLKRNIESIPPRGALDTVCNLNAVFFDWEDGRPDFGFIAQEIGEVIPEVVSEHSGILTVNYAKLVAVLAAACKDLAQRVEELENGNSK